MVAGDWGQAEGRTAEAGGNCGVTHISIILAGLISWYRCISNLIKLYNSVSIMIEKQSVESEWAGAGEGLDMAC